MSNIIVKKDEGAVVVELCRLIQEEAQEAIDKHGSFHLGLSGGSLAKFLCQGLPNINTDWTKWILFFCDERLVEASDPDSTWGLYRTQLLKAVPLTEQQFLVVDTSLSPEEAAKEYQAQIESRLSSRMDLLLLGAGPDGHTCSLFPGHHLLLQPGPEDGGCIVACIQDSPKPPPCRVTLTLPVINKAQCCIFAACGSSKASMMARLLGQHQQEEELLPAQMVQPQSGKLHWILDQPAAAMLMMKMMTAK